MGHPGFVARLGFEVVEEGEFGYVVEDDHDGEDEDADEGDLIDAFLDLLVDVAAHDGLDEEEENHSAVKDGKRQEIHDAEVDADVSHGADDGHPAGHLDGLVDDLADADGPGERTHRDVMSEHAADDVTDEERLVFIEGPGGFDGLGEGELLNPDGRRNWGKPEAVGLGAIAGVHECGRDGQREGLAVTQDGECSRLALLVLHVGE